MINKRGPKPGTPRGNRQRFPYEPRVIGGKLLMPAELQAIHRYVIDTPALKTVTEEIRAVVETVWPELSSTKALRRCRSSSARPASAPGSIRIARTTPSAAADGVVPSALILVDVRHRPMRRSDRLSQGTVSDELNAWKAWAKAKLEEVPYLRLARLVRCPTGADFL